METITFTEVVAVAKNQLPLPHDEIREEGPVAAQLRLWGARSRSGSLTSSDR